MRNPKKFSGIFVQFVAFYFLHQGGSIDVEQFGGPVLDPIGFFEGLQDQLSFISRHLGCQAKAVV